MRLSDSGGSNTVFLHGLNWLRPSITLSSLASFSLSISVAAHISLRLCCLVKPHPAKPSPSFSSLQHLPVPTFPLFLSFYPLSCQHRFAFSLPRPIDPSEPCLQSRPVPPIFVCRFLHRSTCSLHTSPLPFSHPSITPFSDGSSIYLTSLETISPFLDNQSGKPLRRRYPPRAALFARGDSPQRAPSRP